MYFVEKPKTSMIEKCQPFIIFFLVIIVIVQWVLFPKKNELSDAIAAPSAQQINAMKSTFKVAKVRKNARIHGDEELHVVGVYQESLQDKLVGNLATQTTDIVVDRPGQKVLLLISSIKSLKWNVIPTPGTEITDIILNSYNSRRSQVFFKGKLFDTAQVGFKNKVYKAKGKNFADFKKEVRKKIGLPIASFLRSYDAKKEYVINSVSDDIKLKFDYLKVEYPNNLSKQLRFNAFDNRFQDKIGVFNLKSELIKEIPRAIKRGRIVYIKKEKSYYQATYSAINQYDEQGNLLDTIKLDLNLPAFSNADGITYDEINHRIVILTSNVYSYLYFCDLKSKKWSMISLGKTITSAGKNIVTFGSEQGFRDITYDKYRKNYTLISAPTEEGGIALLTLNDKGKIIGQDSISRQSFLGLDDLYNSDSVYGPKIKITHATSNHIIVTASSRDYRSPIQRIYVYDRKEKKVYLVWFTY